MNCASSARCDGSIQSCAAQLLLQTGRRASVRPSMGSWVTYGLGTENQNLPGFIVLLSGGGRPTAASSCGARDFCRASIRACSVAPRETRCCICKIPPAIDRRNAATCSTPSPR